ELERALALDAGHAAAARLLARVLWRAGEPRAALARLDSVASQGGEPHEVALLRAGCLEALGRREDARAALDAALVAALRSPLARRRSPWAFAPREAKADDGLADARDGLGAEHAFHADRRCGLALRLFGPRPAEAA